MHPATLVPKADSIPVPWGWFESLLLLTFIIHLLIMNMVLGGGIISFVHSLIGRETSPVPRDISKKLTTAIALAVNFGVAPLLFLQVLYGHFMYSSSILMAVYWLSIVGLVILAYYSAYIYNFKYNALGTKRTFFIALTVVLLLITAFLFTNNMTLMLHPEKWSAYFEHPDGMLLNTSDPTLPPRFLHFVTASVAVAGLFIALVWRFKKKNGHPDADAHIACGMRWFAYGTLVQILVGLWFLLSLPTEITALFLGGAGLQTWILVLALASALAALILGLLKKVLPALAFLVPTVALMAVMRDLVRAAYLKPYFKLSDLTVAPQYSPLVLFLVSLVAVLAILGYVFKLAANAKKEA